jgi:hypothetical protein
VSLADHYETANDSLVKRTCKTCEWYKTLPPADQAFFDERVEEALAERGNMQRLRRAVIAAGHQIARSTFHGHVHEHHLALSRQVREERTQ